jgi:signal transduction histidine kinase
MEVTGGSFCMDPPTTIEAAGGPAHHPSLSARQHQERQDEMQQHDSNGPQENHYARSFIDPLTSVRAVTELLRDYPDLDAGQQRRLLDLILNSTDRLTHLVDGMAGAQAT